MGKLLKKAHLDDMAKFDGFFVTSDLIFLSLHNFSLMTALICKNARNNMFSLGEGKKERNNASFTFLRQLRCGTGKC